MALRGAAWWKPEVFIIAIVGVPVAGGIGNSCLIDRAPPRISTSCRQINAARWRDWRRCSRASSIERGVVNGYRSGAFDKPNGAAAAACAKRRYSRNKLVIMKLARRALECQSAPRPMVRH